jgi:phage gp37-like protein
MVAYAQLSRTAENPDDLWRRMVAVAAHHGGYLNRFVYEPEPPARVAQTPSIENRPRTTLRLPFWMVQIATGGGDDPRRLLEQSPNPAFWRLVADLRETGGVIVTPSVDHLAFLGPDKDAVLQWLANRFRPVVVLFADSGAVPDRPSMRPRWRLLCESDVEVFAYAVEVVTVTAHLHMSRAGMNDLVPTVVAILTDIVGTAMEFDAVTVPEPPTRLRMQLLCDHRVLRVQVIDTRDHADEPISTRLSTLCAQLHRARVFRDRTADGMTLTCCELPLPTVDSGPFHHAQPGNFA